MKRLIREPLLHFLLLGAVIFAAHRGLSSRTEAPPDQIVVTQAKIENLTAAFARTWQRPPSGEEIEGLVRDYVREEVAVREAIALGLDRDDTIIRRRLRQKLEFVAEDLSSRLDPSDQELRQYLSQHAGAFRSEQTFTFSHIYLDPQRRGRNLAQDAGQLLAMLQRTGRDADASELGDRLLIGHQFDAVRESDIDMQFGGRFAKQLAELPVGQWHGPIESGYGMHLVFMARRTEGRVPALEEIRAAVVREWASARSAEANDRFYQSLLGRYTLVIEPPRPAAGQKILAEARP